MRPVEPRNKELIFLSISFMTMIVLRSDVFLLGFLDQIWNELYLKFGLSFSSNEISVAKFLEMTNISDVFFEEIKEKVLNSGTISQFLF